MFSTAAPDQHIKRMKHEPSAPPPENEHRKVVEGRWECLWRRRPPSCIAALRSQVLTPAVSWIPDPLASLIFMFTFGSVKMRRHFNTAQELFERQVKMSMILPTKALPFIHRKIFYACTRTTFHHNMYNLVCVRKLCVHQSNGAVQLGDFYNIDGY